MYDLYLQVGAVGLLLMGLIATHCMMQLVACSKELCRRYITEQLKLEFSLYTLQTYL